MKIVYIDFIFYVDVMWTVKVTVKKFLILSIIVTRRNREEDRDEARIVLRLG